MKHLTAEELADQNVLQEGDITTVFDEAAMVVEQSRYQAETAAAESPRTHADDEFYYITAGAGKMRVGDETSEVSAGDVVYVDGGVKHDFFDIEGELRTLKVFASA
ncbi:cupin 2 barrel domain protein [Natronomonas pharaonis DSM 2160]|uniref:Cupin 2 barrel domain protein n=1 Tax=Natronomonas pharaonis (strain ATCC 35678 / DSM 2160 / CIP 103997 / JCM 8858 / NBRC 14720 / NCIMB 2260 / Gabara) TaxID=348780 RepID=A0A1U7EYV3_NATPD|nr:cupin domain-containing protein [Natronomonas pharaonis]CAI50450.1 cupin 2 barrel domain protein [Natronomonas pharaonis DSM 2160]